jgi:bla regulator protein blaR1
MILFIVKSSISLFIVLVFYKFYLENEKLHTFNRFFLLASILFCLYLPFLSFEKTEILSNYSFDNQILINNYISQESKNNVDNSTTFSFSFKSVLWCIYLAGFVLFLGRFLRNMLQINALKKNSKILLDQDTEIVLVEKEIAPCSFFKSIFLYKNDYEKDKIAPEIIAHERGHVHQWHSADIILIEILQSVFWFNPIFYLFKKAIQLNHEFLADQAALKLATDIVSYQQILVQESHKIPLKCTSSSIFQLTKQRLIMMTKRTSKSVSILKRLSIIPVLLLIAFLFSKSIVAQKPVQIKILDSEKLSFKDVNVENGSFSIMKDRKSKGRLFEIKNYNTLTELEKANMTKILYFEKIQPTDEMMKNWKNPKVVGLWFNGKRVPNSTLNKYKKEDIAQYFVSKLYGKARSSVSYQYQVDIQTHEHYDNIYIKEVKEKPFIEIDLRSKK